MYLYGSTKILDGDLRPLLNLPRLRDLRLMDRRTYSPSREEIEQGLSHRE